MRILSTSQVTQVSGGIIGGDPGNPFMPLGVDLFDYEIYGCGDWGCAWISQSGEVQYRDYEGNLLYYYNPIANSYVSYFSDSDPSALQRFLGFINSLLPDRGPPVYQGGNLGRRA